MSDVQTQIEKGREALTYFHNQASTFSNYELSFPELLDLVGGGEKKNGIFLEGFGFAIEQVGEGGFFSGNKTKIAMENLATAGQGRIPAQTSFFKALSNEAQNINWIDAAPSVAIGVAADVVQGVAEGGKSVITTLKSLNVVLPLVAVAAVLFLIYSKTKKMAA